MQLRKEELMRELREIEEMERRGLSDYQVEVKGGIQIAWG